MRCWYALLTLTVTTALLLAQRMGQAGDEDLAKELPRIPAHEPAEALKTFQLHDGFRLEQVATEPIVINPVSVCYDEDGRLYAAEMRDYPFPGLKPPGDVALLEDTDSDGRFDKRSLFVEGLSWPTGVVPYDGGVFIISAPDLHYAKDTDGDGKADINKVVFSGFGTQNVQALANGLFWGPDGWIYGVGGGNGGEIKNRTRPDAKPVSIRGRDFRFKPDGSSFEAISGGGQFGHSFDNYYHRFTCNNSNSTRQIVLPSHYLERNPALAVSGVLTDIDVEGGAGKVYRISPPEPWRVVRTRQRLADPEISKKLSFTERFAFGYFTSATGVTVYRGSAFSPEYRGNIFVGDVGGNLVHRKLVEAKSAIFEARRADQNVEFLASTDNWFRPVNFANTPDGCLLILDMYRETIEHPLSIPDPIKKHLDLTSGKNRGRLYKLVPDGFQKQAKPALSGASIPQLVEKLAHDDAWYRETAQRLLIERHDRSAVPMLKELARNRPNALGRMHALWTLDVLGGLEAGDVLLGLKDDEAGVREATARLAERFANDDGDVGKALVALADDPSPMVRFQAAFSLGALKGEAALAALTAIALRDAGDRWVRIAVESSVSGRATALIARLRAQSQAFETSESRAWLEELSALVGAENRPEEIQTLLANFGTAGPNPSLARTVVLGLARGLRRSGGSLRGLLEGPAGVSMAPLFERASQLALGGDQSAETRIEAIQLLGLGKADRALEILPELLDAREPAKVQLAALQTLADLSDHRVGPRLVEHWKSLGPGLRREASEVLLARPDRVNALLDAIESKSILATDLDPARRAQLLSHRDRSIHDRAEKLLGDQARPDRGPVITMFRGALDLTGNARAGKEVFKKVCSTCHKAEGVGTDVGPDLATVTNRTAEDLIVHILDPNREVQPAFMNYNVATTDGRLLSGMIADESATTVTLKRAENATDIIPRNRIEAMTSTGLSLMPENLETMLNKQDMADLIAYLLSLRK